MNELSTLERYFEWDPAEDPEYAPLIIGDGTIGGKGRSLLFAMKTLRGSDDETLRSVQLPRARFIGVGVFREFLAGIPDLAELRRGSPEALEAAFLARPLPNCVSEALAIYLAELRSPIAIRSSSAREDSLRYSFAGKYLSPFILNGDAPIASRIAAVETQIKRVYARTFFPAAERYRRKHDIGDDEMGIAVMRISGRWRGDWYYPTTAGVGFSYNDRRWTARIRREDGMIRLVFGLGTMSTKRGYARTYSLSNPSLRPEGSDCYMIMKHSQEHFNAISRASGELTNVDIKEVWRDSFRWHPDFSKYAALYTYDGARGSFETLHKSSSFSPTEGKVCMPFDGFTAQYKKFFERVGRIMSLLQSEMGTYVNIEFSYEPLEDRLELLQARPLWVPSHEISEEMPDISSARTILRADRMVTDGLRTHLPRLVLVDPALYGADGDFYGVARALGETNAALEGKPYILVAPGRLGSNNPKLGVPVTYDEISGAACIVEVGMAQTGHMPELSYGTHFFTDLEADGVLYMPVFAGEPDNVYDSAWFDETPHTKPTHEAIRIYEGDLSVYMNGEKNLGIVVVN